MNKIVIIIAILIASTPIFAQKSLKRYNSGTGLEIFGAYSRTMYNLENHSQTGFVPVGVRATLNAMDDYLQLGGEFQFNLLSPTYSLRHPFTDEKAYTEKYRFNYLGVFGRFYPTTEMFFARLGMGFAINNRLRTIYTDDYLDMEPFIDDKRTTTKYRVPFCFNLGGGVALGDDNQVLIELVYNYKKNKLADVIPEDEGYNASYFSINIGFRMQSF